MILSCSKTTSVDSISYQKKKKKQIKSFFLNGEFYTLQNHHERQYKNQTHSLLIVCVSCRVFSFQSKHTFFPNPFVISWKFKKFFKLFYFFFALILSENSAWKDGIRWKNVYQEFEYDFRVFPISFIIIILVQKKNRLDRIFQKLQQSRYVPVVYKSQKNKKN